VVFNFVRKTPHNCHLALRKTPPEAVGILEKRYGFKVSYSRNGFFESDEQRREVIRHIRQQEYDVVVCGMGTPLQEKFLVELKEAGWNGYGYTCGGYLHQLATKEKYYPKFFDKLNIRWIYRIYDEPKLYHRYFVLYPVFAFYFFMYCLLGNKRGESISSRR
jgi:N-acetylglucosaminyldiphosphoundecaprenol N-acetyl-beta-D-mannosaminyltransferase